MSFLLRRKASKHDNYILQSRLRGHSGGIVRLCATEDGRFLASGGTDGTKVWNLSTMRELGSPKSPDICGASTALVWIKRKDDLSEALFYGTQNGQLVLIQFTQGLAVFEEISCVRVVKPAEITGLVFDAPSNRLAVCHRGGMVQVYALGSTMALQEVFTLELKNVAPRAIAFGQMYGNERDIMVFGLYGGDIHTLRGSNGKEAGEPWNVGALISDIAIDARKGVLCMDEPSSGANLYRLEDHTRVKTFPVAVTKRQRLRQVDFLDECKFIVSGSDHGIVYVFDRCSGEIVDELRVDPHEWVQTVAAAECAGVSTIFAAKSRDLAGSNEIFIWRKKGKKRLGAAGIACGMLIFLQLFIVVAAVAFVYQNICVYNI
ncbi:WD40-repeat-containing domain protein [Mycena vulgaris]|nr:WD40-repeat-containing domain protein [Mycena vulgaris]